MVEPGRRGSERFPPAELPHFVREMAPLLLWPLYWHVMVAFWSILVRTNPVLHWAVQVLLPHGEFGYYAFLYAFDFLLNFALVLPFTFLLRLYAGMSSWSWILLASILVFLWTYRFVLFEQQDPTFFLHHGAFISGLTTLFILPLAYLFADRLIGAD